MVGQRVVHECGTFVGVEAHQNRDPLVVLATVEGIHHLEGQVGGSNHWRPCKSSIQQVVPVRTQRLPEVASLLHRDAHLICRLGPQAAHISGVAAGRRGEGIAVGCGFLLRAVVIPSGVALHDSTVEEALAEGGDHVDAHRHGTCGLAHKRDLVRIASKLGRLALHEFHRRPLVLDAIVAEGNVGGEEAKGVEAVVRSEEAYAPLGEIHSIVQPIGAPV
mmetsp:Transcript_28284/g.91527  ORF Transcript_28284/g.91527 Transcript_28284/m.91527 type:complete len:219 (-) Transcript_28284:50-706(-)